MKGYELIDSNSYTLSAKTNYSKNMMIKADDGAGGWFFAKYSAMSIQTVLCSLAGSISDALGQLQLIG